MMGGKEITENDRVSGHGSFWIFIFGFNSFCSAVLMLFAIAVKNPAAIAKVANSANGNYSKRR